MYNNTQAQNINNLIYLAIEEKEKKRKRKQLDKLALAYLISICMNCIS